MMRRRSAMRRVPNRLAKIGPNTVRHQCAVVHYLLSPAPGSQPQCLARVGSCQARAWPCDIAREDRFVGFFLKPSGSSLHDHPYVPTMKYPVTSWVLDQWWPLGPPLYADLAGKSVLVTGSNSGIGLEAARHFARMGPKRLILGCRNQTTGLAAVHGMWFVSAFANNIDVLDCFSNPGRDGCESRTPASRSE